jgi:hypothetical protein
MTNIFCYLVRFSPALQPCHVRELTFLLAEMGAVSLHKIGQLSLLEKNLLYGFPSLSFSHFLQ